MSRLGSFLVLIPATISMVALGYTAGFAQFTADEWVPQSTLWGTTGLVNTPTADVLPSNALRFGVIGVDEQWAHDQRGTSDAYHNFLTVGFVPRVEINLRFTYHPALPVASRIRLAAALLIRPLKVDALLPASTASLTRELRDRPK